MARPTACHITSSAIAERPRDYVWHCNLEILLRGHHFTLILFWLIDLLIENGTTGKLVYGFLFALHSNYSRISSRFDILHERDSQPPSHRVTARAVLCGIVRLQSRGNYRDRSQLVDMHRIIWSWYIGRWWCYIWYSDEGNGWAAARPGPFSLYRM